MSFVVSPWIFFHLFMRFLDLFGADEIPEKTERIRDGAFQVLRIYLAASSAAAIACIPSAILFAILFATAS